MIILKDSSKFIQRFNESELKLKATKCFFAQEEVTFLGHFVNANGISPDKDKVVQYQTFRDRVMSVNYEVLWV